MNYQNIHDELLSICAEVAKFIGSQLDQVSESDVQVKALNSLVTYVDQAAERMLVEKLSALTPNAGFITEEGTVESKDRLVKWIIDPLDGTNNFLHKIPHFAISAALMVDDQVMIGVIHDVTKGEVFHAIKGKGAWCNGVNIGVSQTDKMQDAFIATGFPYANDYNIAQTVNVLIYCLRHARGVRRLGAASLDLAYVAAGRFDAYYESILNVWDVAAGILIVDEAGGRCSNYRGGQDHLSGKEILVSNGRLHGEMMKILSNQGASI